MTTLSDVFVTIPENEPVFDPYGGLLAWFSQSPMSGLRSTFFSKSKTLKDVKRFLESLMEPDCVCYEYSTNILLSSDEIADWRARMSRFLAQLKKHKLIQVLIALLKKALPEAGDHMNLSGVWNISAMVEALCDHAVAVKIFRLGRRHCPNYEPAGSEVVIYDWMFAVVNHWRFRRGEDAMRCLAYAYSMLEPDTQKEFEKLERRINNCPIQSKWIKNEEL